MLTEKQRLEALHADGTTCPGCGCDDLQGASLDFLGDTIVQECFCQNEDCELAWLDVYSLSSVHEEEQSCMADAKELRRALNGLMDMFDAWESEGEFFGDNPALIEARRVLALGFEEPV